MALHKLPMLCWPARGKFVKRAVPARVATPGTPEGGEA